MAWRIEHAIVRGEINNVSPGLTTGRIWLIHMELPLELYLTGNCWRDLAGATLVFRNPSPDFSLAAPELANPQTGVVGDMTASLKLRVPISDEQHDAFTWQNHLSIEWFDPKNGRVLIETSAFELSLSENSWRLTAEDEAAQKRVNQQSMRCYVENFLQRETKRDLWSEENADEFAWEKRLQESDRLSDAFHEVIEKYQDDPDSQQKIAFAMGWQYGDDPADFSSGSDERNATSDEDSWRDEQDMLNALAAEDEEEEWEMFADENDAYVVHPVQQKAHDTVIAAMELVGDRSDSQSAEGRLCSLLLMVSSKLAGALNFPDDLDSQESGLVLAILKRCLHWLNDANAACQELIERAVEKTDRDAWIRMRDRIFEIRAEITELRRDFKQN